MCALPGADKENFPCAMPSLSSTWSAERRWCGSIRWPPVSKPLILAKIEYVNPGGSVKDRIALKMITEAEASGELRPGGTIVEPTSGNTGVGLALVAQQRGYHCIFVCPDKVSEDKRNVLRAYGAEVVVCPTAVAPEDPDSYYSTSDRLVRETPNAWKPNQYANPANPASHYETTGPEIWADTDGKVTHFVTGVGTGGTISGTGRYLKDVSNGAVQVIGADPEGSVYSGGTGRPYLVEGVGEDFWPSAYDPTVADEIVAVSDADSFDVHPPARPRGGSAGRRLLRDGRRRRVAGRGAADRGRRGGGAAARRRPRLPVQDLLRRLDGVLRIPVQGRAHHGGRCAARKEWGVAVAGAHPPERDRARRRRDHARVRRLADAGGLGRAAGDGGRGGRLGVRTGAAGRRCSPAGPHWPTPCPRTWRPRCRWWVPVRTSRRCGRSLQESDAVMVIDDGKPAGVLTRADLLAFLAG